MQQLQKEKIQSLLSDYVSKFESQKKAAQSLKNISEATFIDIIKDRWETISNEMWRNVGKQIGWAEYEYTNLKMVETEAFTTFITFFADAKDYGNMYLLIAPCGSGKSYSAEWYKNKVANIMWLPCQKHWNRKWFLRKILERINKKWEGMGVTELMDYLVDSLRKMEKPELIFDEAHKLSDENFLFLIEIYNELHGHCGIVIMGNRALEQKMNRGKNNLRLGFEDIYSRAGRRYIMPPIANAKEIKLICKTNGISDEIAVNEICNNCENDLRRVERLIHKKKLEASKKAA